MAEPKTCECGRKVHARGMCRACYDRWLKLNNPEYAENQRKNRRDWYSKNPDKLVATNRRWSANNIDRVREMQRANKKKHPERNAPDYHARRARQKAAGGKFTKEQWAALCKHYGNVCLRCGKTGKLTVDHVVPLAAGGDNNITNIQPLCGSCNFRKHVDAVDYRPDGGEFAKSLAGGA